MKMIYHFSISLLVSLFLALSTKAQELTVKSMSLLPDNKEAQNKPVKDINGDPCALVLIPVKQLKGRLDFEKNQVIKSDSVNGVYEVYMPGGFSKKLTVSHSVYGHQEIKFSDYGYTNGLKGGYVYQIDLSVPEKLQSSVIINVKPTTAQLTIDDKTEVQQPSGIYTLSLGAGTHRYNAEAKLYNSQYGNISLREGEAKNLTVNLQPIMQTVHIDCFYGEDEHKVSNARVYIDNIYYGTIGDMKIPLGKHKLRIQAKKYRDVESIINVTPTSTNFVYTVSKNLVVYEEHPTPVTVYSTSKKIFKNNKCIKSWFNGGVIFLMPGRTYKITRSSGQGQKIKVGTIPMSITI